jgi:hypothetical protein
MTDSKFKSTFSEWLSEGHLLARPSINVENTFIVKLDMFRNDLWISSGSGFLWRRNDCVAVITAWHNLSGLDHVTRRLLDKKHAAMPNRVRLRLMQRTPFSLTEIMLPLYLDEDEQEPRWHVHRKAGSHFDIAWLGLNIDKPDAFLCANDHFTALGSELLQPGGEVLVAGFPHGIGPFGTVPVWRRASIATNMRIPVNGLPRFLIDVAGRQGMSGSYVCGRQSADQNYRFLGIYTGRPKQPDTVPESSDLGYVWWNDIVCETADDGVLDELPEFGKGIYTLSESVPSFDSAKG